MFLSCLELIKNEEENAIWTYYESETLSIELLKDDMIQKLHFRVKNQVQLLVIK